VRVSVIVLVERVVAIVLVERDGGVAGVLVDAVAADLAGCLLPAVAQPGVLGLGAECVGEPRRPGVDFVADRLLAQLASL
jgi:hypothetical protein